MYMKDYPALNLVKPAHVDISIQQPPILNGHYFLILSFKMSYELNIF